MIYIFGSERVNSLCIFGEKQLVLVLGDLGPLPDNNI